MKPLLVPGGCYDVVLLHPNFEILEETIGVVLPFLVDERREQLVRNNTFWGRKQ